MAWPFFNQSAALVGASWWLAVSKWIVNMFKAKGRQLVRTINLLITDHANMYVLALSHFLPLWLMKQHIPFIHFCLLLSPKLDHDMVLPILYWSQGNIMHGPYANLENWKMSGICQFFLRSWKSQEFYNKHKKVGKRPGNFVFCSLYNQKLPLHCHKLWEKTNVLVIEEWPVIK